MAQTYTQAQLQRMLSTGEAYLMPSGRIIPLATRADLDAAAEAGGGAAIGDPGLRAAIARREAELGTTGKSRVTELERIDVDRFDGVKAGANGYPVLLRKGLAQLERAADQVRRQLDGRTAGAALAKAEHYDRQAASITDQAAAEGYRELAKRARAEAAAGTPSEASSRAWQYEQQAARMHDPADRESYRQLARETRAKAGLR